MNIDVILKLLHETLHAIVCAVVVGATYLVGVLSQDAGFGDVTFVQWLGAVVAIGTAFGVTQSARRTPLEA